MVSKINFWKRKTAALCVHFMCRKINGAESHHPNAGGGRKREFRRSVSTECLTEPTPARRSYFEVLRKGPKYCAKSNEK